MFEALCVFSVDYTFFIIKFLFSFTFHAMVILMLSFNRKRYRKGSPTKMTSDATKQLYSFMLSKRKHKRQKLQTRKGCPEVTTFEQQSYEPQSVVGLGGNSMNCTNEISCSEVPTGSPVLLNVNSQGNAMQFPVAPTHPLTFPNGAQPTLLFLVGSNGMPVTGEASSLASVLDSSLPFANALFFAQPITLNVVSQDTSAIQGGVIEKAMELANFQSNATQSGENESGQSSTELTVPESTLVTPNANCSLQPCSTVGPLPTEHSYSSQGSIAQNLVLAHSVASGENVPIDNVSQSITVQTSQVVRNRGISNTKSLAEESKSEITDTEMASETETGNLPESSKTFKRKSVLIREIMTQTGADPEVEILSERMVDYGNSYLSGEKGNGFDVNRSVKKPGLY